VKQIPLTQGKYAIVDDEDFVILNQHKWNAVQYKGNKTWYAKRNQRVNGRQRTVLMHRQVMSAPPGLSVDHINHNGLDNRKSNLRICSHKENMFNRTPDNNTSSRFKGVYWCRNINKWRAYVSEDKKQRNAGNSKPHKTGGQIQSAILKYIRQHKYTDLGLPKHSVLAYKVEIANERGVPDVLCCVDSVFVGIEIKGSGDRITPIQAAQAKRIIEAGGECYVVKSLNDFKQRLQNIKRLRNE